MISVIHSHVHCYTAPLFIDFFSTHQPAKRKREITAGKMNCCIHFPVNACISKLPTPCSRRRRSAFFFACYSAEPHASYFTHQLRLNTPEKLHTLTQTHMEETPLVWVFKSKQTLMSHLSVSLTTVLLLEQSFYSSMGYSTVLLAW